MELAFVLFGQQFTKAKFTAPTKLGFYRRIAANMPLLRSFESFPSFSYKDVAPDGADGNRFEFMLEIAFGRWAG
jgi:hypothetical protein